jgi:hypothetical protein
MSHVFFKNQICILQYLQSIQHSILLNTNLFETQHNSVYSLFAVVIQSAVNYQSSLQCSQTQSKSASQALCNLRLSIHCLHSVNISFSNMIQNSNYSQCNHWQQISLRNCSYSNQQFNLLMHFTHKPNTIVFHVLVYGGGSWVHRCTICVTLTCVVYIDSYLVILTTCSSWARSWAGNTEVRVSSRFE